MGQYLLHILEMSAVLLLPNTTVNCLHVNSAAVQPRTIMSTTVDDYIGTAFVGDDVQSDDEDEGFVRGDNGDDSLGYGDPEDFWLAD